jgi:uncharacterized DUF497 family protein
MPYFQFIWTDDNEDHVGQHGVTFAEFVEVVLNPEAEEYPHRFPNRAAYWAWTSTGKYIVAIADIMEDGVTAIPVTAFEVED